MVNGESSSKSPFSDRVRFESVTSHFTSAINQLTTVIFPFFISSSVSVKFSNSLFVSIQLVTTVNNLKILLFH